MPKRPKPPKQECARLEWATPAGGWHCGNLIYVYCTAKEISAELLDTFFLKADRCVFAGRPYFLCLVRSDETHRYQPRRREMSAHYRNQGLFFVYESDLADSTPASLFRVSIELDEHTTRDRKTCLLRKNGRRDRQGFAEVRCHFSIALRAAVALWCRKVSMIWLQSEAALYGGAVPSQETRSARLRLSGPYIPYELSVPHASSPGNFTCPVFVMPCVPKDIIDDFLGSVNLPFHDLEQSSPVGLFNIDVDRDAEPYVLKHAPLSTLPSRSLDLSMATICNFIRQNCASSALNARHFVVLDDLTATDLLPKPRQPTVFNNLRALTCLIGDTCARDDDGQPLLVRCSFDACGAILHDLSHGITSLGTCANSAAVDYGGCISYPISYPTSLIIMASNTRSTAPRSIDVTGALPSPNNGTGSGTNSAKKEAHTTLPQLFQVDTSPQKVKFERPPDHDRSVTPDYHYHTVLPHSCALGSSQLPVDKSESYSTTESEHKQDQTFLYGPASRDCERTQGPTDGKEEFSLQRSSTCMRVDSLMEEDGPASDVEDDFYDILLPEVTGSTQVNCA